MTRSKSSLYPTSNHPNAQILLRPPPSSSSSNTLSTLDKVLTTSSSLFIVGSVIWVPIAYAWAWRKWRQIPKHETRKRALYATLALSFITLVITGPYRTRRIGNWIGVRSWSLWKAWVNFIALEIISSSSSGATDEVDGNKKRRVIDWKNDKAIYAVMPHGIFPFSLAFYVLTEAAENIVGTLRPVVATATSAFPFLKMFLGWLGSIDASRTAVNNALQNGDRIALAPGGIAEMFEGYPKPGSHPNDECIILKSRKGFIRLAIQHGIPVVPVYCFGATKMFKRLQLPMLFELMAKIVRIGVVIFFGRFGLPIPYRQRLLYVMGQPIYPSMMNDDSIGGSIGGGVGNEELQRQVNEMHQRFCEELTRLFNEHKESYGWGHKRLRII